MVIEKIEKIESMLLAHQHSVVSGSEPGKALFYLAGQWSKLIRFLDRGDVGLDNHFCENALRPFAIGRKKSSCSCPPPRPPTTTTRSCPGGSLRRNPDSASTMLRYPGIAVGFLDRLPTVAVFCRNRLKIGRY